MFFHFLSSKMFSICKLKFQKREKKKQKPSNKQNKNNAGNNFHISDIQMDQYKLLQFSPVAQACAGSRREALHSWQRS